MARLARVEWNGIPIDPNMRKLIDEHFPVIAPDLMDAANRHYGKEVFVGKTLRPAPTYALIERRAARPQLSPWPGATTKQLGSRASAPLRRDDY
jgi:hypothetical protein